MDTFSSNYGKERREMETEYAYPVEDSTTQSKVPAPGFGFGLLKALRLAQAATNAETRPAQPDVDDGARFAGFISPVEPARSYVDTTPVYKGEYENLCPLYFNTEPVDNANDTRLDRTKLSSYTRAQLFFLLRLERFLRLRYYWLKASPRQDEQWKTDLALRGIFSAYRDCSEHDVCDDAKALMRAWECC